MWLGVCVAIVIELVPKDLSASAVAVYFFIIQIIGGNMTLFVTPLTEALSYRGALLVLFPGMYIYAALLFIVTLAMVTCRDNNKTDYDMSVDISGGGGGGDHDALSDNEGTFKSDSKLVLSIDSLPLEEKIQY